MKEQQPPKVHGQETSEPLPVDGTALASPPAPFVQPLKAAQHFDLQQASV